jgi:hypothetical protein
MKIEIRLKRVKLDMFYNGALNIHIIHAKNIGKRRRAYSVELSIILLLVIDR